MKKLKTITSARPGFYRQLFVLVLPIVLQNLITSAVSMADVVMLGRTTQTYLSASSLAGQVQFLLNVVYFGLNSAITIMASQYWGKGDAKTIAKIFGIGLYICVPISAFAAVFALVSPRTLIGIWTNVPELIDAGSVYLRFVALSYFFAGFSQPYLAVMKSCERVKLSTVISFITLGLNVILNAVLIFGLFGMPAMGIAGAALATSISRGCELAICASDFLHQKIMPRSIANMLRIPGILLKDFCRYSLPAFINDMMWGLAFNMNSIIMGHLGSDIVAANSVVTVARELVTTVGFGISSASSIMLGKEIGENLTATARSDASSVMRTAFIASLLQGIILIAVTPIVPEFAKVSSTAKYYMKVMLIISCVYQIGQIMNTVMIASLFRCGGDSRYGMILDICTMWLWAVPAGLISAFVLNLPPLIVYAVMCTDEFVKMPFALHHYKHADWIRNLTRDIE